MIQIFLTNLRGTEWYCIVNKLASAFTFIHTMAGQIFSFWRTASHHQGEQIVNTNSSHTVRHDFKKVALETNDVNEFIEN